MRGILQLLAEIFGKGVNAYDIAKKSADAGDEDAQNVINTLDRAMTDTGVIPTDNARSKVGNIILQVAFLCDDGEDIDLDESPELEHVIDTYDRFMDLLDEMDDASMGEC